MAEAFLGQIMLCPYSYPPAGWMDCAGQLLPIAQYSALYALLGTNFGGNGSTNFALPDLRGRAAISTGQHPGGSNYTTGDKGGAEVVALSVASIAAHTHGMNAAAGDATHVHGYQQRLGKTTRAAAWRPLSCRPRGHDAVAQSHSVGGAKHRAQHDAALSRAALRHRHTRRLPVPSITRADPESFHGAALSR